MHASQEQHQTYLSLANHHSRFSQALPLPFFPLFGQRCSRMNTHFFFCFLSSTHGNKGGYGWDHFFFITLPFHCLITMLFILFFLAYITSITCWWHVSTHSMASHYALIWLIWHARTNTFPHILMGHLNTCLAYF